MCRFVVLLSVTLSGLFQARADAGTQNRVLTFFTSRIVSWNHAVEICASVNSNLITVDNEDVYMALRTLKNGPWNTYWSEFWTGLHFVQSPIGGFLWQSSCAAQSSYRPWLSQQFPTNMNPCVVGDKTLTDDMFLMNFGCNLLLGKALCEKVEGSCSFKLFVERFVSSVPYDPTVLTTSTTEAECKKACLQYNGEYECWAAEVSFDVNGRTFCKLYHDVSGSAMRTRIGEAGTGSADVYLKVCFSSALNFKSLTSKYVEETNAVPWKGCPNQEITTVTHGNSVTPTTTGMYDTETIAGDTPFTPTSTSETSNPTSDVNTTAEPTVSHRGSSGSFETATVIETSTTVTETNNGSTTSFPSSTVGLIVSKPRTTYSETVSGTETDVTPAATFGNNMPAETEATLAPLSSESSSTACETASETVASVTPTATFGDNRSTFVTAETEATLAPLSFSVPGTSEAPTNVTGLTKNGSQCCACRQVALLPEEQKRFMMADILAKLSLNKSQVSSNQRRYHCAEDSRLSAMAMGYLGVVLMSTLFACIILVDIKYIVTDIKYFVRKYGKSDNRTKRGTLSGQSP